MGQCRDIGKRRAQPEEQEGFVFNDPDPEPFCAALSKAGFYRERRGRHGEGA